MFRNYKHGFHTINISNPGSPRIVNRRFQDYFVFASKKVKHISAVADLTEQNVDKSYSTKSVTD